MVTSIWLWLGFAGFVLVLLAFDLGLLHRKQREIGVRESLLLSGFYVVLAAIFAAGVFHFRGEQAGLEFTTGYLIEKSLSLDNIFVIALIFTAFAVPLQYRHRVLFWGILGRAGHARDPDLRRHVAHHGVPLNHLCVRRLPDLHRHQDGAHRNTAWR